MENSDVDEGNISNSGNDEETSINNEEKRDKNNKVKNIWKKKSKVAKKQN